MAEVNLKGEVDMLVSEERLEDLHFMTNVHLVGIHHLWIQLEKVLGFEVNKPSKVLIKISNVEKYIESNI